ncbi:DUF2336 domain-containing protein [Roseibium sp. CAU 1637]|uniref:DUF2336 domain-containing protein n=1 Tax=Roseibium limicola TaxID=2816037 RepID=A0A939ENU5_9HYPH|nr:DUF2336 domain-containing protein [Roseibium limicola]MBO0345226.1 DUF2336 domain-containing protein [Roseibium limicola]
MFRTSSPPAIHPPSGSRSPLEVTEPSELLKSATELFAARANHTQHEVTIFRELAMNLLPQTPVEVRRTMAKRLMSHPTAPRDVLLALAGDTDTAVSFPLLRNMDHIPTQILVEQAERGPDSLRRTIAERHELAPDVIDTLMRHSGTGVIEILLLRSDLRLTESQIDTLLKRPDGKSGFGQLMRNRAPLSDSQLMGHFLHLSAPERNQALAAAELLTLTEMARKGLTRPIRPVFKSSVLTILRECAMAPGPELFTAELCYALRLPRPFVQRIISADDGQTLAIGLKAIGFEVEDASRILVRMLGDRMPLSEIKGLLRLYARVSHGAAMTLVDRWIGVEAPDKNLHRKGIAEAAVEEAMSAATTIAETRPARVASPYQETSRPAARQAGSSERDGKEHPWKEIAEIENLLKFG